MTKPLTIFERRHRLLAVLRDRPGIRVAELATLLEVTEGTVRNDLNALSREGRLRRVRGGGIPNDEQPGRSEPFMARLRVRDVAKMQIARWAAELVEDGDTVALDASTTVYCMAQFLQERHSLTIVTNGIEVGRKLARNPSHSVMLLGGLLNADGNPVTDLVSEGFLNDLHIKSAFVSCYGFSPEGGLTERDVREAQLKRKMIASAGSVIALIDAKKFGKASLAPFARAGEIAHVFTDSSLQRSWIEQLRGRCPMLTVCDEDSVTDYALSVPEAKHYRIGFANLDEAEPFAVDVRRGLERAAQAAGNVDLVLADNQLSSDVALAVAEKFASDRLDLVIEYQIDEQVGSRIMDRYRQAGIPVIAVDIPMIGATYFGVDNYRAGHMAGVELGEWIRSQWGGQIDRLIVLVEPRAGTLPAARIQGQLDGLASIVGEMPAARQLLLDCGNTAEQSEKQVLSALRQLPPGHHAAVISFNDDAAIGALNAARRVRREADVVIVGQGADRRVREALRDPGSRIIGSTAYGPECYGEKLIALAQRMLRGDPVPPAVYVEHTFVRVAQRLAENG
jgi:ribose transport system substrate-binding protein